MTAGSSWSRTLGTGACTATTWRTACAAWSPLTIYGDVRHGDLEIDTGRGLVYAVREDHRGHGEAVNTLVAIPLDGSAARDDSRVRTLVSGTDFVVSPTLSPDGEHLA